MQKILSLLRRCVEDYDMIAPGERVAVGVSLSLIHISEPTRRS